MAKKQPTGRYNVVLPQRLHRNLRRKAKREGRTISSIITSATEPLFENERKAA